jgi:hypothetical protein
MTEHDDLLYLVHIDEAATRIERSAVIRGFLGSISPDSETGWLTGISTSIEMSFGRSSSGTCPRLLDAFGSRWTTDVSLRAHDMSTTRDWDSASKPKARRRHQLRPT